MSPKLTRAVKEWQELHLPACTICGSNELATSEVVVMPRIKQRRLTVTNVMSFVPIACLACGYVVLVSMAKFKEPRKKRP